MSRTARFGFSFLEVVMTVFILAVCCLPLLGYIQGNVRATGHTQDRSLALALGSQAMERFRNLTFNELVAACGADGLSEPQLVEDRLLKMERYAPDLIKRMLTDNYARTVTFKQLTDPRLSSPSASTPKVGLLTVTVSWKPQNIAASKMTFSKIIVAHQR
ncbi:MAG: hypothetical protein HY815_08130 [Candidatus Riflebacteria bacterium]|nr:hypothetical protein [Candidatus Riflebacteria bacterium]